MHPGSFSTGMKLHHQWGCINCINWIDTKIKKSQNVETAGILLQHLHTQTSQFGDGG